jgi:hypothetical protein
MDPRGYGYARTCLPQAKLGNLRRVRLGFDDHGLGNLINHCFNSHSDSRMRTCGVPWFGCASSGGGLHTIIKQQSNAPRMRRAIALPHPKLTRLQQVEIVLELRKQLALALEQSDV